MATFAFRVQAMKHNPDKDERICRGEWVPSKCLGFNILDGQALFYRTDRGNTQTAPSLPVGHEEHRAYSVYNVGDRLLIVPFDATAQSVGDGLESTPGAQQRRQPTVVQSTSSDEDEEPDNHNFENWAEPRFNWADPRSIPAKLSRVGRRLEHKRMEVCRWGGGRHLQPWVEHFFPDRYRARNLAQDTQEGGLVGELALLIAIAAVSQPVHQWPVLLRQTVTAPYWQVPQQQINDFIRNGQSRVDRQGVVVVVYTIPGGSSKQELELYENGRMGKIFA